MKKIISSIILSALLVQPAFAVTYAEFVQNKANLFANHKILLHNIKAFTSLLRNAEPPLSEDDMYTAMLARSYTETTDKVVSRILALYTLQSVQPTLIEDSKKLINTSDLDGIDTLNDMRLRFSMLAGSMSNQKCKDFIENNILNIDQAIDSIKIINEYLQNK